MLAVDEKEASLTKALENDLLSRFGPLVGQDDLRIVLGYPTMEAFRQAHARRQLPIPVFGLPNRRGKFALAKDIAQWLVSCRSSAN